MGTDTVCLTKPSTVIWIFNQAQQQVSCHHEIGKEVDQRVINISFLVKLSTNRSLTRKLVNWRIKWIGHNSYIVVVLDGISKQWCSIQIRNQFANLIRLQRRAVCLIFLINFGTGIKITLTGWTFRLCIHRFIIIFPWRHSLRAIIRRLHLIAVQNHLFRYDLFLRWWWRNYKSRKKAKQILTFRKICLRSLFYSCFKSYRFSTLPPSQKKNSYAHWWREN